MNDIEIVDYAYDRIIKIKHLGGENAQEKHIRISFMGEDEDSGHFLRSDLINSFNRTHAQCIIRKVLKETMHLSETEYNIDWFMLLMDGDCDDATISIEVGYFIYDKDTEY